MNTTHHTRRVDHYKRRSETSWGRGFLVGLIFGVLLAAAWFSPVAHGAPNRSAAPPFVDTWLAIAACEQPKPGGWGRWGSVNWTHNGPGVTFPGGGGMQTVLWRAHRRPHMKHVATMDKASPLEQVWAMYRFWTWAERTYPGYGYTGWECSEDIGWTTGNPADAVR